MRRAHPTGCGGYFGDVDAAPSLCLARQSRSDVDAETANRAEAHEKRKVYDTTLKGRGNSGHLFGDHLSDSEVLDLIEYLKTF